MSELKIYEQISDYIDGNMSDEELRDFELKMNHDSGLKKEVEDNKGVTQDIKKMESLSLPNNFDLKLKDAINRSKSSSFSVFKLFDNPIWATTGSIAAAILLVITVTIFFSETQKNELINIENEIAFEDEQSVEDVDINLHQAKSEKKESLE